MILGNNLFGMASLPQERALSSFYFHYFIPTLHPASTANVRPTFTLTQLPSSYGHFYSFHNQLMTIIKSGCDQFMTNNKLVVDISHS
jgi:hypothetical protein